MPRPWKNTGLAITGRHVDPEKNKPAPVIRGGLIPGYSFKERVLERIHGKTGIGKRVTRVIVVAGIADMVVLVILDKITYLNIAVKVIADGVRRLVE